MYSHEIKLIIYFLIISQIKYGEFFQLNVIRTLKNKITCSNVNFLSKITLLAG